MVVEATLCFIFKEDKILLIYKKKGFGKGKVNGVGGRIEEGESLEEAAKREVREEVGLEVDDLEYVGLLEFYSTNLEPDWRVHVFKTSTAEGVPAESEEAKPLWFKIKEIPYDLMWEDSRIWLPLLLKGRGFRGRFWFSEDYSKMLKYEIKELR